MTTKKTDTIKKQAVKKEVKKPLKTIIEKPKENKKEFVKTSFPVITTTTVNNFEINWFSLSKMFKSKFRFIYLTNKDKLIEANKTIVIKFNTISKINNLNTKIKKYYECFNLIWDYYINKKQDFDLNKRIMEIMNYDC